MEIQRIELEKLANTRDLGGFETEDGHKIRPHRLIRSGELYEASAKDIETLTQVYDLKTIVDFRTDIECMDKPDPEIAGVQAIHNPILSAETMGITREKQQAEGEGLKQLFAMIAKDDFDAVQYMERIYENIVCNTYSMNQYQKFFDILLKQEKGAVLWHCSAGKDRVGVGTALLLTALGVPREVILEDYVKVNEYTGEKTKRMVEGILHEMPESVQKQTLREKMTEMFSVQRVYMEAVFEKLEAKYGTMENCLTQALDLDEEKINRLKELYLEEV